MACNELEWFPKEWVVSKGTTFFHIVLYKLIKEYLLITFILFYFDIWI
jgi:hypothetical protein